MMLQRDVVCELAMVTENGDMRITIRFVKKLQYVS